LQQQAMASRRATIFAEARVRFQGLSLYRLATMSAAVHKGQIVLDGATRAALGQSLGETGMCRVDDLGARLLADWNAAGYLSGCVEATAPLGWIPGQAMSSSGVAAFAGPTAPLPPPSPLRHVSADRWIPLPVRLWQVVGPEDLDGRFPPIRGVLEHLDEHVTAIQASLGAVTSSSRVKGACARMMMIFVFCFFCFSFFCPNP
jgi:hypothetical protein